MNAEAQETPSDDEDEDDEQTLLGDQVSDARELLQRKMIVELEQCRTQVLRVLCSELHIAAGVGAKKEELLKRLIQTVRVFLTVYITEKKLTTG